MFISPVVSRRVALLTTCAGAIACMTATTALAQDVTRPGDSIVGSSGNYPAAESPDKCIDNSANTKYLNFDELNTGFTVLPTGTGIVRAIGIITANDAPERDPTSYILEGSDDGVNFVIIAQGPLNPNTARYAISQDAFANSTSYVYYRVTFPTVRTSSSANSMQVAEVQLNTNINVLTPGDPFVTTYTAGASSGTNETAASLFDNRLLTKLGVFNGNLGPTQIDVTPGAGASVVRGLEIFGGNDDAAFPGRTPANITLLGSNDGVNYTQIYTTALTQVTQNYQGQQFDFTNNTSYTRYRVILGASSATFLQVGELRLMGTVSGAAPPNDNCAGAQIVAVGSTAGNNFNATGTDTTSCGTNDALDVWYSYHANNSGPVEINTIGDGELDTVLAIYDGCGGTLVGCDDNSHGSKSRIRFNAVNNHNYKIRIAGAGNTTGGFTLNIIENPTVHTDTAVALPYNFNGIVHTGEQGQPDNVNGYRSLSDRGFRFTGGVGSLEVGLEGRSGIPYTVVTTAGTLDTLQIGDRNTTDNGNHAFDFVEDGDDVGIQPSWLPNASQNGPHTITLAAPIGMGANTKVGLIYNASNGGNDFDVTFNFASGDPVTVRVNAPDWYGEQNPDDPGPGIESQVSLGAFFGTQDEDTANDGVDLNCVEAVISTASLSAAFGDVTNRQLTSISVGNAGTPVADIGIYAMTIRDPGSACAADFNGDSVVDFFDYLDFVQAFSTNNPIADFNHDSVIDFFDYLDFLQAFNAGC